MSTEQRKHSPGYPPADSKLHLSVTIFRYQNTIVLLLMIVPDVSEADGGGGGDEILVMVAVHLTCLTVTAKLHHSLDT